MNLYLTLILSFCCIVHSRYTPWRTSEDDTYRRNRYFNDIENERRQPFADSRNIDEVASVAEEKLTENEVGDVHSTQEERETVMKDLPADGELFEGDMVMDSRLREAVLGKNTKKSAFRGRDILWPDNVVYYEIDDTFVPEAHRLLKRAIHEFEKRTCIRFKKRTNQPDYVLYSSAENTCSSVVGKAGGQQTILIGKDCTVIGTVLHETMHALGIIHEHSRPDRDDHVDVKWDNIKKKEWNNFNKYTFDQVTNLDVPYNFMSVMHYRNDAFTKNHKDTLVPIGQADFKFGQRSHWTRGDVKQVNYLYNCNGMLNNPTAYENLYDTYDGYPDREPVSDIFRWILEHGTKK